MPAAQRSWGDIGFTFSVCPSVDGPLYTLHNTDLNNLIWGVAIAPGKKVCRA